MAKRVRKMTKMTTRRRTPDLTARNLAPLKRAVGLQAGRIEQLETRNFKFGARIQRLEEDLRGTIEQVQFLTKRAMGAPTNNAQDTKQPETTPEAETDIDADDDREDLEE